MYPFHLIISTEVPDFDPSMAEYDKDRIKSFFSDIGYNKKFVESIDDDFCDAFHKSRTAIFKTLERKFNALEELEQEHNASAWISVKDRFPEYGEIVLIRDRWETFVGFYAEDADEDGNHWRAYDPDEYIFDGDVLYWMPIPEPPKGENNG